MKVRSIVNIKDSRKEWVHVYRGCESIDDLRRIVEEKVGVSMSHVAVIRFMDAYYGVIDAGLRQRAIIGLHLMWHTIPGGTVHVSPHQSLPYPVNRLRRRNSHDSAMCEAFRQLDNNAEVYVTRRGQLSPVQYVYRETFLIMLLQTFQRPYFDKHREDARRL